MPPSRTSDRLPRTNGLSLNMAILGLLDEQSDTLGGIAIRLERRFPDALWSRSALPNGMKGLVRQGHAQLVQGGGRSAQDRYETTNRGAAYFHAWKRNSATVPRMLRDALQGKLAFSTPADLPDFIGTAREDLSYCERKYASVHKRLLQAESLSYRSTGDPDYDEMMLCAMLADQAARWDSEVQRLQGSLKYLQRISKKFPVRPMAGEAADG
jgi:hypothetical protein